MLCPTAEREVAWAQESGVQSRFGLERESPLAPEEVFEERFRELRIKREGFGRYRVKDEVGRGGMGVVLRVWGDELKRHLAMKLIRGGEDAPTRESAVDSSTVGRGTHDTRGRGSFMLWRPLAAWAAYGAA